MSVFTISSRKFNQDASGAKRLASKGPVVITDRGRPAHVLLTIERYREITGQDPDIVELLAMPDADQAEFEPKKRTGRYFHPADIA